MRDFGELQAVIMLLSLVLLRFWRAAQASWTFRQRVWHKKWGSQVGPCWSSGRRWSGCRSLPSHNQGSSLQITSSVLEQLQTATTYLLWFMMIIMCHTLSFCIIVCPITFPHGPNCLDILCCAAGPCISASPRRRKSAVSATAATGATGAMAIDLGRAHLGNNWIWRTASDPKSKSMILCKDCNDNITDMYIYIYLYIYIYRIHINIYT